MTAKSSFAKHLLLHLLAIHQPKQSSPDKGLWKVSFIIPLTPSHQVVCSTKSYLSHSCLVLVKVHILCYVYLDTLMFKHLPTAIGAGVPDHVTY